MAFETPGIYAYVIEDTFLVAYTIHEDMMIEMLRHRLYAGPGTSGDVQDFLEAEARTFDCHNLTSFGR